jgi:hypothetical protein
MTGAAARAVTAIALAANPRQFKLQIDGFMRSCLPLWSFPLNKTERYGGETRARRAEHARFVKDLQKLR